MDGLKWRTLSIEMDDLGVPLFSETPIHTLPFPSKRFDFHHGFTIFLKTPPLLFVDLPKPTKPNPENRSSTSSMKEFFTTTWMQRPDPLCSSPNSFCHLRKRTVVEKKSIRCPDSTENVLFPTLLLGMQRKHPTFFVVSPVKRQLSGHLAP